MANQLKRIQHLYFENFEIDLRAGQLHKEGEKIPLEEKPFQLLTVLLEHHGEPVDREQLRRTLWPTRTYGDFDHSLNIAISKLRHALSDSTECPKYIETLTNKGYRFIASVKSGKEKHVLGSPQREEQNTSTRLIVLPFESLGGTPEQIYFSEGLSDEIATRLGHLYRQQLGVIARTSTMEYGTTTKDIGRIVRDLKVNYILSGRTRHVGDRIRITAHLIKTSDHTYLWADSYDYRLGDPITIQDEVAERIAHSLGLELVPDREKMLGAGGSQNGNAHLAYLKGRYYQLRRTEEMLAKSVECFERAIQLSPNYALAYSALAISKSFLGSMGFGGGPPREFFPQAMAAARKALEITDTLAECYISSAFVKFYYEWDWMGTEQLLLRAIELNPSNGFAHQMYGLYLSSRGKHAEAIRESQQAFQCDPLSLSVTAAMGMVHYFARQYDDAVEALQNTLELEPTFGPALMWLGAAYVQKGMCQKAVVTLEKAKHDHPGNTTILACAGETYGRVHMEKKALKMLEQLAVLSRERYVPASDFALIYLGLGQMDKTFEWLDKAYDERSPFLAAYLKVDPRFEILWSDPRYQDLLTVMGAWKNEPE